MKFHCLRLPHLYGKKEDWIAVIAEKVKYVYVDSFTVFYNTCMQHYTDIHQHWIPERANEIAGIGRRCYSSTK